MVHCTTIIQITYNRVNCHHLCSTHHTLASHLLFLHKLDVTSTDRTGAEKQERC